MLQQLERLDEARLKRAISNDQLIISVADVVRQSLRLDEGTGSFYRTTDEWMEYLKKTHSAQALASAVDPGLSDSVELVLREADVIKFAGKAATLDQARIALDAARRIVRTFLRDRTDVTQTTPNEGTVPKPSPR